MNRLSFHRRAVGAPRRSASARLSRATTLSAALALTASGAGLIGASPVAAAGAPVTTLAGLGATVTLPHSLDRAAAGTRWLGAASGSAPARALISLQHRDEPGLLAFIAAVSDPHSAQYRHYLTAAQFDARYAPTSATVLRVESYLTAFGLKVTSVPVNRAYITVSGDVAQMQRAFSTTIDAYMRAGAPYQAPVRALSIPATLRGVITGVTGLNTGDIATPQINSGPSPLAGLGTAGATNPLNAVSATSAAAATSAGTGSCATSAPTAPTTTTQSDPTKTPPDAAYVNAPPFSSSFNACPATQAPGYGGSATLGDVVQGYTPQQVEGGYGIAGAIAGGLNGAGQTVAVIDAYSSPTMVADADQWSANMGLPKPNLTIDDNAAEESQPDGPTAPSEAPIIGGASLQNPSGWFGEESLDVEAVHAMAPAAAIIVQSAMSAESLDLEQAQNAVVTADVAKEISNSYGGAGGGADSTNSTSDGYWQQAAAQGQGVEFSSGDSGDNTSGGTSDANAGVDDDANSPYVTAVGGTTMAIGPADNYEWETYWSDQTATLANGAWGALSYDGGGGGGVSQAYGEPDYQKAVVPTSIADFWQNNANASGAVVPGRVVPDVAMLADPNSGFLIGLTQDFSVYGDPLNTPNPATDKEGYSQYRIGGTSLSSPLFAGLMALADQAAGAPVGFANPALYALYGKTPAAFHDPDTSSPVPGVVRTNYTNGTDASGGTSTVLRTFDDLNGVVQALPGYDDSTGLGSPDGLTYLCGLAPNSKLLQGISGSPCAASTPSTPAGPGSSSGGSSSASPAGTTTSPVTTSATPATPTPTASPRTCTLPARLRFVQHTSPATREIKAVLYVNGARVRTIRGRRIGVITLKRPAASRFTLKLVATLSDGEVISHTLRYRGCAVSATRTRVLHQPTHRG